MSDFKIGNSPQPIHEQTEASSEATLVTERSATPARLKEPDFSKVMEGGLAEHLLNQRGGGPSVVNGPYGGSAEAGMQSASDWLLQQGVFPGGEGMSLKQGPMGGVVDPPNDAGPSVNAPMGGNVVPFNNPGGGATDPPPNVSAQQGMDGGSNMSIPQIKFTDRPEKTVNLPSTSFDANFGNLGGDLPADIKAIGNALANPSSIPSTIADAVKSLFDSSSSSPQQDPDPSAGPIPDRTGQPYRPPGDYELTPYDTEGDPTVEDTGDNPSEEVV